MHDASELQHHTDFDLESFRFFGSVQFYTLFFLLTFLSGHTAFGTELALLLGISGIIMLLLKIIILAATDYEHDLPSITAGLATIFFIMIVTKNPSPVYIILSVVTWLTVQTLALFDSYLGSTGKSIAHVLSGTAIGAEIALVYKYGFKKEAVS